MKVIKRICLSAFILFIVLAIQDCKREKTVAISANDADSLYIGRPYILSTPHTASGSLVSYQAIKIPISNPMTYEGIQLGRMLFYDSTLSVNHRFSCASCHKQQYAFGDNLSKSTNAVGMQNKRNAEPLINMGLSPSFFWDGRKTTIEDAVEDAMEGELHPDFTASFNYLKNNVQYQYLFKKAFGRKMNVDEPTVAKAIAQFIRTLNSTNSKIDSFYKSGNPNLLSADEDSGLAIFFSNTSGDCYHCHFTTTSLTFVNQFPGSIFANNGIDTVSSYTLFADAGRGSISGIWTDYGRFKIPTLRNVEVSGPYMHDGRMATLDEVIDHYNDGLKRSPTLSPNMIHIDSAGMHLDAIHKRYLIAFLKALTDTSYLHNPDFSNPFH